MVETMPQAVADGLSATRLGTDNDQEGIPLLLLEPLQQHSKPMREPLQQPLQEPLQQPLHQLCSKTCRPNVLCTKKLPACCCMQCATAQPQSDTIAKAAASFVPVKTH